MSVHGHIWTVAPLLAYHLRPQPATSSEPFRLLRRNDEGREIPISGFLTRGDARRLADPGARARRQRRKPLPAALLPGGARPRPVGAAPQPARGRRRRLRFLPRRPDRDLLHLIASPELAGYEKIWVQGFSVGGHVVLKLATELADPRVQAVAAICSPLDLEATVTDFDRPGAWPYRRHVFRGLLAHYEAIARQRPIPTPVEEIRHVSSLRRFDELTVVKRFGFGTAHNYYSSMSAGPRLGQLKKPALLVATEEDPMVTARSVRSGLDSAPPHRLKVVWSERGGHVGFPPGVDLGLGAVGSTDEQVHHWLLEHG